MESVNASSAGIQKDSSLSFSAHFLPVLIVLGCGLLFSTRTGLNFSTPKLLFLRISTLTGFSLFLFRLPKIKTPSYPKHFSLFCLLLYLFFLVHAGFKEPAPMPSQTKLLEEGSLLLFFFLTYLAVREFGEIKLSLTLLELLAIPLVGYGFLQHWGLDPIRWSPGGNRIFSFLGNADYFAGFLAALFALSGIRFLFKPAVPRLLLLLAEWTALFWSYTRGPFVALFLLGVFFLLVGMTSPKFKIFSKRLFFFSLFCILSFFILFSLSRAKFEKNRFMPAGIKGDPDILGRIYLLRKGIELFTLHPMTGVGPGNFTLAYLPFREDDPPFYRKRIALAESTHNTFLDALVETGFWGGTAFFLFWILILHGLFSKAAGAQNLDEEEAQLNLELFSPLLSAFFCLQFYSADIATEILTTYLLGASVKILVLQDKKSLRCSMPKALFAGILLSFFILSLFLASYGIRAAAADWFAGKGAKAMDQTRWKESVQNFSRAVTWNPWDPALYQKLGKSYELLGNPGRALLNYNTALKIQNKNPYLWADIGRLASKNHWKKRALTAYLEAVKEDPYNPIFYHDAAVSAFSFQSYGLALYYAKEAESLLPEEPENAYQLALAFLYYAASEMPRAKARGHKRASSLAPLSRFSAQKWRDYNRRKAKALLFLRESLKKFPSNPRLLQLKHALHDEKSLPDFSP